MLMGLRGWTKRLAVNPLTLYVIVAGIILFSVVHHLGTQPAGMNSSEVATQKYSQSLSAIINNPINAPHNLLAYGLHSASLGWKTALRLSSALFGAVFLFCFYLVVRAWFSGPIGMMGAVLLAGTPLLLVSARQGSAEIMLLGTIAVLSVFLWAARTEKKDYCAAALLIVAAILAYTPGIVIWLIAGMIVCRRKLASLIELSSPAANVFGVLLAILIIVPLGIGVAKDWTILKILFLIPTHITTVFEMLKHIAWMLIGLFVRAPYHNDLLLGRFPALSLIQDGLLAFGIYALWSAARPKLMVLISTVGFAILAAGINNNYSLLILGLPSLAIIICAGLRYLFIEWRSVFPRNPLARSLAFALMWAIVIVQLLFGIRYAVIAWPNTVDTKSVYVLK